MEIAKLTLKFFSYCEEKKLSEHTVKAYKIDLNQFILNCEKLKYKKTTDLQINAFDYLSKIKVPATRYRKLATLKALFTFAEEKEIIKDSPVRKMHIKLSPQKTDVTVLSREEIKKIVLAVYNVKPSDTKVQTNMILVRDIAIIELIFGTGIRTSELCSLKTTNISLDKGHITVSNNEKTRRLFIGKNKTLMRALKTYYILNKVNVDQRNSTFFLNRNATGLSDQSIRILVNYYAVAAGIKTKITPSVLRDSVGVILLNAGTDIKRVQRQLGHRNLNSTERLLRNKKEEYLIECINIT